MTLRILGLGSFNEKERSEQPSIAVPLPFEW